MEFSLQFGIIVISLAITVQSQRHNICKNYWSYVVRDFSKSCRYSPDIYSSVCEIVGRHVGECEIHNVTTEDGHILSMFRIPKENPKGVVLLQHPLASSANTWTLQEDQATAFQFWRQGYDVWMGNSRGNRYARKHVDLTISDSKFWDFSFHEMGVYDCKAMIEYIRNETEDHKVIFVGHSLSTTSILAYASLLPELSHESLEVIVHMAPIANLIHVKTPAKHLSLIWRVVQIFNKAIKSHRIGDYDGILIRILRPLAINAPIEIIFPYAVSFFGGWTPRETDPAIINLVLSEWTSASSWKTGYHYAQIVRAKRFQMYDYGAKQNMKKYGSRKPPLYPLGNITTPTFVIHSSDDYFSVPEDVDDFYDQLRPDARAGKVLISGINHADCHSGKHRIEKCYVPIFKFLDDFRNK